MNSGAFANPIFVALDTPSVDKACELARVLRPHVGGLKIGLEFITANGPDGIKRIIDQGLPVFADVKFHDIPNTVAGASREIAKLGVAMFNVHASGGTAMMRAAVDAAAGVVSRPKVIAVTVLTSIDDEALDAVGQGDEVQMQVHRLAVLARDAGLDGVVCGPKEAGVVRAECPEPFLVVTPGVRPVGGEVADQRRVATATHAIKEGASILVIGRPITGAADPAEAARAIATEIAAFTAGAKAT